MHGMRYLRSERLRRLLMVPQLVKDQQKKETLCSRNSSEKSAVRFYNVTGRHVELYWIDYGGRACSFGILEPGTYLDVSTFVTHPWIFVDEENSDRYVVKQKNVFWPEACLTTQRMNVFIQTPIPTLYDLALEAVAERLRSPSDAHCLELPMVIAHQLDQVCGREQGRTRGCLREHDWSR